ncbi:MAG: DUF1844 domain-containing protein [Pyrinomonadaceae bacterium]
MNDEERRDAEEAEKIKVTDRRKFNFDGSLRDGIEIKESVTAEPDEESRVSAPPKTSAQPENVLTQTSESLPNEAGSVSEPSNQEIEVDEAELNNPASFINFISTLVTNAAAALGAIPHPVTGQASIDLETGKLWIDVLGMLREKTKGNLSEQESRVLESVLSDLQLQYVAISRAAEEQLKAKAAEKFSSKDILGG